MRTPAVFTSSWDGRGPILTDSGGFQAFSLGAMAKLSDEAIVFRSHLDGSLHRFTPEAAVSYQERLGGGRDDVPRPCAWPPTVRIGAVREAMERTHRWAARCREAWRNESQALFGIVQGGISEEMRRESAEFITGLGFSGYAVGGLAVGETKVQMYEMVSFTGKLLPQDKPRYLMGVGSPEDLVEGVAREGMDMFDCALPTRVARNGALFTPEGEDKRGCGSLSSRQRADSRRVRLPGVRRVFDGVRQPSVPVEGAFGIEAGVHPQPAVRTEAYGGDAASDCGGRLRGVRRGISTSIPSYGRVGADGAEAAVVCWSGSG